MHMFLKINIAKFKFEAIIWIISVGWTNVSTLGCILGKSVNSPDPLAHEPSLLQVDSFFIC